MLWIFCRITFIIEPYIYNWITNYDREQQIHDEMAILLSNNWFTIKRVTYRQVNEMLIIKQKIYNWV